MTKPTLIERITYALQWARIPIGFALAVLMVWYIGRTKPQMTYVWAGMAVAAFGEWVQVWAAAHLRKNQDLAASGPYLRVRNPMYVGRFFVLLGFILMTHNWVLTTVYVIMFAFYAQARVGREEARLREIFGEKYLSYCRNVRRWLPRITPYDGFSGRRFDWHQVVVNHEYLNVIGVLVLFVAVYAVTGGGLIR